MAKARRDATFHGQAAYEYRSAIEWYRMEATAKVAEAFRLEVDRAVTETCRFAERQSVYDGEYRWVRLTRFPYLLVFRILDERRLLIVAVAHERRAPGYWRLR